MFSFLIDFEFESLELKFLIFSYQETSYNHLLRPTTSNLSQDGQLIASKLSQSDAKEIDIESTCGGNEQPNLQLQVHSALQRNTLNWYDNS